MEKNNNTRKENSQPKVSVIVPIYNGEKFLRKCLDSIVNQTLKDIEIILVNDGSVDESYKICQEYAKKDHRIILRNQKNKGSANARNQGMKLASGQYIGFVDSDDFIDSTMFSKLYEKAKKYNADIVNCDCMRNENDYIIENKVEKDLVYDKEMIDDFLLQSNTTTLLWFTCRNIYRRSLLENNNIKYIEGNIIEDSIFNLTALMSADIFYAVDAPLYHYMENPDSQVMSNSQPLLLEKLENVYNEKLSVYQGKNMEEFKQDLYNYTISNTLVMLLSEVNFSNLDYESLKIKLKEIRNTEMIEKSLKNDTNKKDNTLNLRILTLLLKYKLYGPMALLFMYNPTKFESIKKI